MVLVEEAVKVVDIAQVILLGGVSTPKASGGGGSVESALSLNTGEAYTITVGAGGASATGGGGGQN